MLWIAWAIVALLIVAVWAKYKKESVCEQHKEITEVEQSSQTDYSKCYQAKYLLTKNEWHEHKKLQNFAAEKGLVICPKVRLLDIIEPRKNEKNYKSLLYKVQSKHVDFLICDQTMHIKAVLELDDNSHNQKDRQSRDAFVDQILSSVGYKVIRTHSITKNTLDCLTEPEETKALNPIDEIEEIMVSSMPP